MRARRKTPIVAYADPRRLSTTGVAAVASYTTLPQTSRPVKIRGLSEKEPDRYVIVCLTHAEALKAATDIAHFLGRRVV